MISCKHFKCVLETLNKISTGQQKFLSNPKMSIVGIAKGRQKLIFWEEIRTSASEFSAIMCPILDLPQNVFWEMWPCWWHDQQSVSDTCVTIITWLEHLSRQHHPRANNFSSAITRVSVKTLLHISPHKLIPQNIKDKKQRNENRSLNAKFCLNWYEQYWN